MVERNTREIKREKEQVEKLLLNIMPRSVYEEFKAFGVVTPQLYDPISVLMLDFVGFTDMVASADPSVTVTELNDIYSAFDRIGEQFGCERIKTIGDFFLSRFHCINNDGPHELHAEPHKECERHHLTKKR